MPDVTWNANDLRALAESVDSVRNEVVYIVELHDSPGQYRIAPAEDVEKYKLNVVMACNTVDEESKFVPPKAKRTEINLTSDKALTLPDGTPIALGDFDAIFTSLSAVEKFVVPYYAGFQKLEVVEQSRLAFAAEPQAVAVLHTPKSVSFTGMATGRSLFKAFDRERGVIELDVF